MKKTIIAASVATALFSGDAWAACRPNQINGSWLGFASAGNIWVECELAARNGGRNASARCRGTHQPFETTRGTLSLAPSCIVNGQFGEGTVRGIMEANGQTITGVLLDGPGRRPIDKNGVAFTFVRRP